MTPKPRRLRPIQARPVVNGAQTLYARGEILATLNFGESASRATKSAAWGEAIDAAGDREIRVEIFEPVVAPGRVELIGPRPTGPRIAARPARRSDPDTPRAGTDRLARETLPWVGASFKDTAPSAQAAGHRADSPGSGQSPSADTRLRLTAVVSASVNCLERYDGRRTETTPGFTRPSARGSRVASGTRGSEASAECRPWRRSPSAPD